MGIFFLPSPWGEGGHTLERRVLGSWVIVMSGLGERVVMRRLDICKSVYCSF